MKKIILPALALATLSLGKLTAQNETYMHGIGVHFGTIQYNGDLANQYYSTDFGSNEAKPAIGLSYNHYINKSLDANITFMHGTIRHNSGILNPSFRTVVNNIDLMLRYKFNNGYMLPVDFPVAPFLHVGVGDAITSSNTYPNDNSSIDFNFPLGGGIVIAPASRLSGIIQTTHHWTMTDAYDGWQSRSTKPKNDNFLFTSVGLKFNFNTIEDMDRDGVPDDQDLCPETKGSQDANGCPDTDGDGVSDKMDKCKTLPGIEANKGCPKVDKADLKVLSMAMQGLYFETGSANIKEESKGVLNNVVDVLKRHPEYNLAIEGHTDNTGDASKNLQLSKDRAAAAKDYLVANGIDASRIASDGYGQTRPVASNDTEEGRAKNRRVNFMVVF